MSATTLAAVFGPVLVTVTVHPKVAPIAPLLVQDSLAVMPAAANWPRDTVNGPAVTVPTGLDAAPVAEFTLVANTVPLSGSTAIPSGPYAGSLQLLRDTGFSGML
jgi:hypothetical protein